MKTVKTVAFWLSLLGLTCFGAVWAFKTHDDAFTEDGLLEADASDLQHSIVTSHLQTPLSDGENVLWCGSFQLAWNEACALAGGNLHFVNEPAMVAILNKKQFTEQDLNSESYVAVADFIENDVHGQIERQLIEKFKGQATPSFIPSKDLTPRPQDIVAYAYLFKHLEFHVPFEIIDEPLEFGTEKVPCFGIGEEYKSKHSEMLEQVVILDYKDKDDFVVELKTKSEGDRLILTKIQPKATLKETLKAVQERAANPEPIRPRSGDILKVPKFNFDVTREYQELMRKKLLVKSPKIADDLEVLSAVQNVRFQFDEKGVRLRSESHIAFGCSADRKPQAKHIMVFDKPFLVVLQRSDADVPYFALWVDNAELLVKAK